MTRLGPNSRSTWDLSKDHADLRRPRREEVPVSLPARFQSITVDLARTAIIVVDMQNDFCHPDGWLASIGVDVTSACAPVEPLMALLPALRDAGVPVVWLNWGNRPDRANLPPSVLHVYSSDGTGVGIGDPLPTNGAPVLQEGSWAADIVAPLAAEPGDIRVSKYRMSGFWDTPLDTILRQLDVDTLLFAGVNADQCVFATLIDAACAGYDVVFLDDCCATTSPAFCWDATVHNVAQCFGFVATSTDLLASMP